MKWNQQSPEYRDAYESGFGDALVAVFLICVVVIIFANVLK